MPTLNGSYTSFENKSASISAVKTGYKPLGVVGFSKGSGTGSTGVILSSYRIYANGTLNVIAKNLLTSSATVEGATVDVLYQKL